MGGTFRSNGVETKIEREKISGKKRNVEKKTDKRRGKREKHRYEERGKERWREMWRGLRTCGERDIESEREKAVAEKNESINHTTIHRRLRNECNPRTG